MALAGLVLTTGASAQPAAVITDRDAERAVQQHRVPTDDEVARAGASSGINLNGLPGSAGSRRIDLGSVAAGYDGARGTTTLPKPGKPQLLVFISFSMPEATLRRLAEQASAAGATLVLRGLVNGSIVETVSRVHSVAGDKLVAVRIDPEAFVRFGVNTAPTFVLAQTNLESAGCSVNRCLGSIRHVKLAGDMTLAYALKILHARVTSAGKPASAGPQQR